MKVEYLLDGSSDCPLIRLFDFDAAGAGRLQHIFVELSRGTIREIALHHLPWLATVDGCELTLRSAAGDRGVLPVAGGKGISFECALTPRRWETIAALTDLTEPFCQSVTHGQYQWLDEMSGISLLLTPDGRW